MESYGIRVNINMFVLLNHDICKVIVWDHIA